MTPCDCLSLADSGLVQGLAAHHMAQEPHMSTKQWLSPDDCSSNELALTVQSPGNASPSKASTQQCLPCDSH
eukprot:12921155-Prorocentrum_lima.AAC.1